MQAVFPWQTDHPFVKCSVRKLVNRAERFRQAPRGTPHGDEPFAEQFRLEIFGPSCKAGCRNVGNPDIAQLFLIAPVSKDKPLPVIRRVGKISRPLAFGFGVGVNAFRCRKASKSSLSPRAYHAGRSSMSRPRRRSADAR